jgi:tRNA (guanine37-N1)-methyltransferase
MEIHVFTALPQILEGPMSASLLGRARERGLVDVRVHDLRHHTTDRHRSVDDSPFGGGAGMVLTPEPVFRAVEAVAPPRPLLLLDPGGRRFDQAMAAELAAGAGFSLLCGRYEGVDERVVEGLDAEEISIGDYVVSGGEVPALVLLEAVTRLVPGVIGREESHERDSFEDGFLDHPHYTRPREFRGMEVPPVLLSGNHAEIEAWRRQAARAKTERNRPDLLDR